MRIVTLLDLPEDQRNCILAAKNATTHSYAPYSNFHVGAAVLIESGEMFSGTNIENASYGMTICAERVAIFKAVSEGFTQIKVIALFAPIETSISPCGACRQVILEFAPKVSLISSCNSNEVTIWSADELLPNGFGPHTLKK